MAKRTTRSVQKKTGKREKERIETKNKQEKASFSMWAMRILIGGVLVAMIIGMAISILQ